MSFRINIWSTSIRIGITVQRCGQCIIVQKLATMVYRQQITLKVFTKRSKEDLVASLTVTEWLWRLQDFHEMKHLVSAQNSNLAQATIAYCIKQTSPLAEFFTAEATPYAAANPIFTVVSRNNIESSANEERQRWKRQVGSLKISG